MNATTGLTTDAIRVRLVQLTSGERLEEPEEREDGVLTDAGIHPWSEVAGFWTWHVATQKYMFIPV